MKWLTVLFLYVLVNFSFSLNYDPTVLEDPLQPVWDRFQSLSQDILDGIQEQMKQFLQATQRTMDEKFQDLRSDINKTDPECSNRNASALVNEMKESVTAWIEDFYRSTIKRENDAAIAKAEGSIRARIDALEDKLTEHINVKFESLADSVKTTGSNSSGETAAVVRSQLDELESKMTSHVNTKLTHTENSVNQRLEELSTSMTNSSFMLASVSTHVTKITEELSGISEDMASITTSTRGDTESCTALVTQIDTMINGSQLSTDFLEQQEIRWKEVQSVIADVRDTPSYLPRDCSDIHWRHSDSPSGVYQIYPTLDRKDSVSAWCEMADNGDKADGGWTVLLRRRETDFGHIDFNRTWEEYSNGFGDPAEGEWWFSLISLHALTYRQPYNVRFLITDIEGDHFVVDYSNFRVEDRSRKFRLIAEGFSGNVTTDVLKAKHHGMPFSTPDQDNDNWAGGSCSINNQGGWWFDACHFTTLTAPFPTSTNRGVKTIRWRNEGQWLVLNDVTMKIRPVDYGKKFDVHGLDEST